LLKSSLLGNDDCDAPQSLAHVPFLEGDCVFEVDAAKNHVNRMDSQHKENVSRLSDDFLAGAIAPSAIDLKVNLLASGQMEATSYAWYLVDRDYGEERVMLLADQDPDTRLTSVTHREDVTDCDAAELTKKFLSLWDMKPMDWAIILREGQVNFSLLDQGLMTATVAEGFKELGQPFDVEKWMKNVSFRASA
jgi:hypothetical protein